MDSEQLGDDADRVDVRRLSLVRAGADRRVPLDVLDRGQTGAERAPDVGDGGVPLEVDEHRVLVSVRQAKRRSVGKPAPGETAGALDARELAVGHRRADALVPAQPSAGLAPEVHARAPAARDCPYSVKPVAGDGAGEHHPGAIVVLEDLGPLERSGRQDDPSCPNVPEATAALDCDGVVGLVEADGGGPSQHLRPVERGRRAGVDEDHTAGCGCRRGNTRSPAPDDEDVAVHMGRIETAGGAGDEPALTGERYRLEAVLHLDERRPQHRLRADLNERVRLLLVGREHPARPVTVDAAEPTEDAVAHERGGEGLPLAALVLDAVEAELHGANSFVEVSRTASNQRRQPCVCTQRSCSGPFVFARTNTNCDHSASERAAGSAG